MVELIHLKNMRARQIGSWNPKVQGENKKYLSCHHLDHGFLGFCSANVLPWCSVSNFINDWFHQWFHHQPSGKYTSHSPKTNSKLAPENRVKRIPKGKWIIWTFSHPFLRCSTCCLFQGGYLPKAQKKSFGRSLFCGRKNMRFLHPLSIPYLEVPDVTQCCWGNWVYRCCARWFCFPYLPWSFIGLIWKKMEVWVYNAFWLVVFVVVFHQPIWKICSSKWVHLPQVGVKINNIWVATT